MPLPPGLSRLYAYVLAGGASFSLIIPVMVLYLSERGFLLEEVGIAVAVNSFSHMLSEVPTGVIADRISRKMSLLLSGICRAAAYAGFIVAPNIVTLALFAALHGLGLAFGSGTVSAFLYDTLKEHNREGEFQGLFGLQFSFGQIGGVAGALLAAALTTPGGLLAPMVGAAILGAVAAVFAGLLVEPTSLAELRAEEGSNGLITGVRAYLKHTRESIAIVLTTPALLCIVYLILTIQRASAMPINLFAQPHLVSLGWRPNQIALVFVLLSGVTAILSRISHNVNRIVGGHEREALFAIVALVAVGLVLLASAPNSILYVAALVFLRGTWGLFAPFQSTVVNRRAPSKKRATVASIAGLGFPLSGMVILPAFGRLADVTTPQISMQVFGLVFFVLIAVGALWGRRVLSREIRTDSTTDDTESTPRERECRTTRDPA